MKPEQVLDYESLYEKIWMADDPEAMKKLLLDEAGARQAWRVIELIRKYKGFDEGFWRDIPDYCRCNIFNDLANLFRDEPLERDEEYYLDAIEDKDQ